MRWLRPGISVLFFSYAMATTVPIQVNWMGNDIHSRYRTESWDLTEGPGINSTSNYVFDTVNSFLQHWPNTRYRNGHTLALATVPQGTLLYHGSSTEIPKGPEWVAVDPEHSYLLCAALNIMNTEKTECRLLTLVTTRSLKLLYFDGSSAAKMNGGPMDSQDLLLWGEIKEEWVFRERERINKLCEWGKKYGLDGFVRMEMDFEIMLCDFTAGVKEISYIFIVPPKSSGPQPPGSPPPPSDHQIYTSESPIYATKFERPETVHVIEAASWANRFPGEIRIKIDYSKFISFYDADVFPSLQKSRMDQERWDHRLEAISKEELKVFFVRLDELLSSQDSNSGIDWQTLLNVVTNRYAERLEMLRYILNSESTSTSVEESVKKAHRYVSIILTPYRLRDVVPPTSETENGRKNDHDWATPIFKYCATAHTDYLWFDHVSLSASETLLLSAIRNVSKEICRVLVNIWAEGEEIWSVESGEVHLGLDNEKAKNLLGSWRKSVSDLMEWLDWSFWVRCRPDCGFEEICYMPTWPYFFDDESANVTTTLPGIVDEKEWRRPQPRCIRRLEPYDP